MSARRMSPMSLCSRSSRSRRVRPTGQKTGKSDSGAVRILLEGKFLFDVIDLEADFTDYRVVILPDAVRVDEGLRTRLADFCAQAAGASSRQANPVLTPVTSAGDTFALDLGVRLRGRQSFLPRPITAPPSQCPNARHSGLCRLRTGA